MTGLSFSEDAVKNPAKYLAIQDTFLNKIGMPTDPEDVYKRYTNHMLSCCEAGDYENEISNNTPERIMFVSNDFVPTLQLSFIKPLANQVDEGKVTFEFISERYLKAKYKNQMSAITVRADLEKQLNEFKPTLIVFCRYSGHHSEYMRVWAKQRSIPTIYHIDDDLLTIPENIGKEKHKIHNSPYRLESVQYLLNNVDLVYCSTEKLRNRLEELKVNNKIYVGKIYCSGQILERAENRDVIKIGYMASADHAHNLTMVIPAIEHILAKYTNVQFELFGSIPVPERLEKFGEQISRAEPISNYNEFLQEFSKYKWDIGICPLVPIPFNLMKANTKWVEYTSVGAAVVANKGTVYDEVIDGDCGLLAESTADWIEAFEKLIESPRNRFELVKNAQHKIESEYSLENLRAQVFEVINQAKQITFKSELKEKILFISNGLIPTLQLSFIKPLKSMSDKGEIDYMTITEQDMVAEFGEMHTANVVEDWLHYQLSSYLPTVIILCRYSGPHSPYIRHWAKVNNTPVIYHIDDDLLNIPKELGLNKHKSHSTPMRLGSVRYLLDHSDLIYCSTAKLKQRLKELEADSPIYAGDIYCSGQVMVEAEERPIKTIGYMGFDHAHDFELVIEPLVKFMRLNTEVNFELFGSIPKPVELEEFGDRVILVPPVRNYREFLKEFAKRKWDIGLCPLQDTEFNQVKANTKWVEYSSVGIAVIASFNTVYDDCCEDNCGILARDKNGWFDALDLLSGNPNHRYNMVKKAQQKLIDTYSEIALKEQVLNVINQAKK
ncbi:glycosyltransferase [Psychrosphaera haliotis]|uniref:Glycosyltransferase n=1 Tax=Psychrosphaera haliotis TaxID=555083 RepID=A0A6N8F5B4_9GAMM|nr:glycosyltransferase [Psychrosphaera haliotis]MUH71378.1 glycosyltransferase [Psychrosphaera haliotis]